MTLSKRDPQPPPAVELQILNDEESLGEVLRRGFGYSGQLLKKHLEKKYLARPLRARDTIRLPIDLVNHLLINPSFKGPRPTVLKESGEYLALHKPPFVHSHPLRYSDESSLLNFLAQERIWSPLRVNQGAYDRGLVHRLDLETSGVILLAKTEDFHRRMRLDFGEEMRGKFYWAIVDGIFDRSGSWTHHFRSHGEKGERQRVSDVETIGSREGTLSVRVLQVRGGKSLLLVELKTGLRHQIRAQLAHLGFPIYGDQLYGGRASERVFLHSWRYHWSEVVEDANAELFERFFDLHGALQMCHNVLG